MLEEKMVRSYVIRSDVFLIYMFDTCFLLKLINTPSKEFEIYCITNLFLISLYLINVCEGFVKKVSKFNTARHLVKHVKNTNIFDSSNTSFGIQVIAKVDLTFSGCWKKGNWEWQISLLQKCC